MNATANLENHTAAAVVARVESAILSKPLSAYVRSKLNVRKKKGTRIEELAASIHAQGLLQNLIGYEQKKKGKPTGKIEVVGGGRRLDGLQLLHSLGKITDDYPVPCKMVSEEEAIAISLAENSGREEMCLADQFGAMKELIDNNKTVDEVAAAFGMSPLTVQRRLKLANVSPRLFSMFRDEHINLDQMMALAQTDDHALQEQVWDSLPGHSRNAWRIREMLTKDEINMKTDPVARYVGAAAYEKAGGVIRRDLFSDDESGYMVDGALLMTLALAKLNKAAKQVEKEGFAWVEVRVRLDYAERNAFGHVRTMRRDPTDDERKERAAIDAEQVKLDADYAAADDTDDADYDALDKRSADLGERRDAIESALPVPHLDDLAVAGAVVTVNQSGKIETIRGLVRPEDKRALSRSSSSTDESKEKPVHSERLTRELTAQRTAALQAVLMSRPDVALVALTARLAKTVFSQFGYGEHVVKVSLHMPYLKNSAVNIEHSRAWKALQARREEWEQRLPGDDEPTLFAWLLEQPQAVVLELLAFCTACSVDAVQSRESAAPEFNELAKAVSLNMAEWWTPTRETYLGFVTKPRIIDMVAQAVSVEAAQPLAAMKKEALIASAEHSLSGTGWLPEVLKVV
jgi:ParB family chromosome partitioning protein